MINKCFLFRFFLLKNSEEEVIKVKYKPVRLEILIHIIYSLKRNMSEEVIVKPHKSLPVDHKFVCNDILPCVSRKHMNQICGKVVS